MFRKLFSLVVKRFSKVYTEQVRNRIETLRIIYQNRENAIIEKEENLSLPHFIFSGQDEINERARYWEDNEGKEKYITQALLETEYMLVIKEEDRKLIERGALLYQKLMEDCVKLRK